MPTADTDHEGSRTRPGTARGAPPAAPWRHMSPFGRLARWMRDHAQWFALVLLGIAAWVLYDHVRRESDVPAFATARTYSVDCVVAGTVVELSIQPGQRVKLGQIVGRLESIVLTSELAQARMQKDLLESTLASTTVKYRLDQAAFDARVKSLSDDANLGLVQSRIDVQKWKAELAEIEVEITRLENIREHKLGRVDRLGELKARRQELGQLVAMTPKLLDWYEKKLKEVKVLKRSSEIGPGPTASLDSLLKPIQVELQLQKVKIRQLEQQTERLVLRAPAAGIVKDIHKRNGEVVPAGISIATIEEERPSLVTAYIPDYSARNIRVGTRVKVYSRAPTESFRGIFHERKEYPGTVFGLGQVNTLPDPFGFLQRRPVWVRTVIIQLQGPHDLIPGERMVVVFP